jgi:uncharacterized protein YjbI with pentapeptide repeats
MKKSKKTLCTIEAFFLLLVTASFTIFSGCGDSVTNSAVTTALRQAMVERQFVLSSSLKAEAGAVIVVDLEDLNSPAGADDTGPIGEDIIPYNYTSTAEHRFEIADSSNFKIKMVSDSSGATLFELNPASSTVVTIPAGNYKLHLISLENYSVSDSASNVVFIQPNTETAFTSSLSGGYNPDDLNTLLNTRKCVKCNLDNANFDQMNLSGVTIGLSSLQYAGFNYTNLQNATIVGNVIRSNFYAADLRNANMQLNVFYESLMNSCLLDNTNFHRSILFLTIDYSNPLGYSNTNFSGCDLSGTVLKNVHLDDANFDSCRVQSAGHFTILNSALWNKGFTNSTLTGSNFSGVVFGNFKFENCNLSNSSFTSAEFRSVSFCRSNFTNARQVNSTVYDVECWPF